MSTQEVVMKLVGLVRQLSEREYPHNSLFSKYKDDAVQLMKDFAANQYDPSLVDRSGKIISGLEGIEYDKIDQRNYEKAKAAAAVIASRVRRSHYAAYVAGRYSRDENVGFKYKCWLHNAAANGAISLHETIEDLRRSLSTGNEIAKEAIRLFSYAARCDARHFLDLAEVHDPLSSLTAYNNAKYHILSSDSRAESLKFGVETILAIAAPDKNADEPDLRWHKDNYQCFSERDTKVRSIIQTHFPNRLDSIDQHLGRNYELAAQFLEEKPPETSKQTPYNLRVIVGTSVGAAISALLYFEPELHELLKNVVAGVVDLLPSPDSQYAMSSIGDGGLPFGTRVALATFGDGGLPFA